MPNYSVAAGEIVTFDLTYGIKTVYNNYGVSLMGQLSADSDITQFTLQPDPIVPGGLNHLDMTISYGSTITQLLAIYYNRYISVD